MAKSEALSRETLGRRKLFRKERRDKVPNLVASYDHAIGGSKYNSYALPAGSCIESDLCFSINMNV